MAVHHGGKVGSVAKKLASNSTSKSAKSKAGKHWLITWQGIIDLNS